MSDDNEISKRIAEQLRRLADARNEHAAQALSDANSLTESADHLTKGNE